MDGRISVPLRTANISGKKMRKRRELDALVASNGMKRFSSYNGGPVCVKPGTNYHDQLLSESTDDQDDYWRSRNKAANKRNRSNLLKKRCSSVLNVCTILLVFGCVMVTSTVLWLFLDIKHQANYLHGEMDQVVAGNQGVPELVQQCHSQTKELQKNQSEMNIRIIGLNSQLHNLSKEISKISNELKFIQHKLNSTSESGVPNDVMNWISELNDTVAQLKQSENHLDNSFQMLTVNVSSLKEKLSLLDKVPKFDVTKNEESWNDLQKFMFNLTNNITSLNSTINDEISNMKKKSVEDHMLIENLQSLLSKNISLGLNVLQEDYKNEQMKIMSLNNTVKNLTDQFDITRVKLRNISEEMQNLLKNPRASHVNSESSNMTTALKN